MKNLLNWIILFSSLLQLTSCNKSDEKLSNQVLNYTMDCTIDSTYYYYTLDYEKVYLDISTLCVSIMFKDEETEAYRNTLLKNNPELVSISLIDSDKKIAYGYLMADISCEETKTLLTRLTQETGIVMANPNFILKECVSKGSSLNDVDCLMGLTNEFVVKLKNSSQTSELASLINITRTKLLDQNELYTLISVDKNSMGNSLEMSRYFYETGYFEYAHPNFIMKVTFNK